MSTAGTFSAARLDPKDIVRPPRHRMPLEPLIGVTSAQSGQVTVALPSDEPGNPGPGLISQQNGI